MRSTALSLTLVVLVVLAGCSGGGSQQTGAQSSSGSVGLAVGGAQDANAFRDNLREGYVPQPTDVTYEGLFHDYYFDTGQTRPCEELFCPSYSRAVSRDPLSNESEHYLTVGLNSGVNQSDFERKKLNLVVVVDTSGSMDSPFRKYHYDGQTAEKSTTSAESAETTSKMAAAKSALTTMTGKLDSEDRLAIVGYDDEAQVVQELRRMDEVNRDRLAERIDGLKPDGSTNLDAGMRTAKLLAEAQAGDDDYATRIVYLTDAMPNLGDTDDESLESRLRAHEQRGIHTTFVGVGVDFNTKLAESITSVRGANYYVVHSTDSFRERMDEGFAYMVTPMVYDLSVTVESEGYRIESVYGSPESEAATGEVMHAKTLFPSRTTGNKTEGGVILLKLERTGEAETLNLTASYETPAGEERSVTRRVEFPDREPNYYETTGARKAIALSRYADLVRNWAAYERVQASGESAEAPAQGIESRNLSEWEQQSVALRVSPVYRDRIDTFESYFESEMNALNADRMRKDLILLRKLADFEDGNGTAETVGGETTTVAEA